MTRACVTEGRERGFALLIVLWALSLVALIGAQVTSAGRTEARIAANLRGAAVAEAAADAAVQEAGLRLLDSASTRWRAGGEPRMVRLPHATVQLAIEAEAGKLPLNTTSVAVLAGLLVQLGQDAPAAERVAEQVVDWRSTAGFPLKNGAKAPAYRAAGRAFGPPGRPFRSVAELRLLLAMTPALYDALAPHVSAHSLAMPEPAQADPLLRPVLTAMQGADTQAPTFAPVQVFRIVARATAEGGGRFTRVAVIQLAGPGPNGPPRRPFDVLEWAEDADGA